MLTDGPVGYWRLGEQSGSTAYDSSGSGLNGTINGGVALGVPGAIAGDNDTAMRFDGSTGYISLGDPASLQPATLSVELWLKSLFKNVRKTSCSHLLVAQIRGNAAK